MSRGEVEAYYYDRREKPYYDEWGVPHTERRYADTLFKADDERTKEAAAKGGRKSGEVRRRKAARKTAAQIYTADFIYDFCLDDVTTEELREFIRWRGQRKRKATLAQARLLQTEEERQQIDSNIAEYLDGKEFTLLPTGIRAINKMFKGQYSYSSISFVDAKKQFYESHSYEVITEVIHEAVNDFKRLAAMIFTDDEPITKRA